jgi:hypothetical protein
LVKPISIYKVFARKSLSKTKYCDLGTLMPWSNDLPVHCRVPNIEYKIVIRKKQYNVKGKLHKALQMLREKYRNEVCN